MHMEECIENILAQKIQVSLYELRQSMFHGSNDEGRIEHELVSSVCKTYFRTRNPRKKVVLKYVFEEYLESLRDAGFVFDGNGGVIGVSGLPDLFFFENEAAGDPDLKEEDGGPVLAVGAPVSALEFIHISVSPKTFAKHFKSFVTAVPEISARMREEVFRLRREMDVASIEYPYLEQRLAETLGVRNIRYKLGKNPSGTVLYVQIVKEIWMQGELSMANVERVISLTPYFILRPDCLKAEMPDFRIVRRYDLAR